MKKVLKNVEYINEGTAFELEVLQLVSQYSDNEAELIIASIKKNATMYVV